MTSTGHIQNGAIVLDAPIPLPDGTPVRVETIPAPPNPAPAPDRSKTLAERLPALMTHVLDLPADAAEQHDHYLYGTPKQ